MEWGHERTWRILTLSKNKKAAIVGSSESHVRKLPWALRVNRKRNDCDCCKQLPRIETSDDPYLPYLIDY